MSDVSTQASTNPIAELKVSGHLMTLEPGLFCVYNAPGGAPPNPVTGLPGVRLTAAPGPGGLPGQVSIKTLNDQGWLAGADGAALVRVSGGPAQVLVTVYQGGDGGHDAPKLQVIRLSEGTEPAPAAAPAPALASPEAAGDAAAPPAVPSQPGQTIEVGAHIYGRGDVGGPFNEWMGEPGSKRWIEGFGLMPASGIDPADVEYQAVLGRGWLSPWAEGGQFCGSRGMSLPILGLRVRLRGPAAEAYSLAVSASFLDGTQVGPILDGSACEAPSLSPLEAFRIELRPAGAAQADPPAAPEPAKKGRKAPKASKAAAAPAPEEVAAPAAVAVPKQAVKRGKAKAAAEPVPPAPPAPMAPAVKGRAKSGPVAVKPASRAVSRRR